jgi:hypothetical protein
VQPGLHAGSFRPHEVLFISESKILECYRTNFREKNTHLGLYSLVYQNNDTIIRWGCELGQNIYFGFKIWYKDKLLVMETPEIARIRKVIFDLDNNYQTTPGQLFWQWQYTDPRLNFYEFRSTAIFNLLNNKELVKIVQAISEIANNHIKLIQLKLVELEGTKN